MSVVHSGTGEFVEGNPSAADGQQECDRRPADVGAFADGKVEIRCGEPDTVDEFLPAAERRRHTGLLT